MERHIRLLDCTLRDGGHIVQGRFGEAVIKNTIEYLVSAGVDIIEVGFLWDEENDINTARYCTIADVKRILPENHGKSKFALMADNIDLNHLEPYDGTIEYIRLSFKRWRLDWGIKTAKVLMDKGYRVFINPVNNNVYSDKKYIDVLEKVNELHPYGFSIVDTFGVMRINDLSHRYFLVENNLQPDIAIGVHLHENLGLAYALAQHITSIANPKRNIVIDGSLLGMGRVPGNLCIEQFMDFMNDEFGCNYATEPVYDAIDDYIAPIKKEKPWGYDIPYALSAKYNLHRTYAEYLINKKRLKTKDIQRMLSQIPNSESETFNEGYVEKLYKEYMNVSYDDKEEIINLRKSLLKSDIILIIAPGQSICGMKDKIIEVAKDSIVISVNFIPDFIETDYVFFTNTKRIAAVKNRKDGTKLIITSNLVRDIVDYDYTISYNELTHYNDIFCDDSTLMLLKLLSRIGVNRVFLAGFDGQKDGILNFYDDSFDRNKMHSTNGAKVKSILYSSFDGMVFEFITESAYERK